MRNEALFFGAAGLTLMLLTGCAGAHSTVRYGADGEAERYIECSGQPMSACYRAAIRDCPQGYRLIEDSQTAAGTKSGSVFGTYKTVGGTSSNTQIVFKNQLIIRCKPVPAPQTP